MSDWETTSTILTDLRDYDNRDAWGRLFGHFQVPLVRFGMRCHLDREAAEDAAQETLMVFARAYREGRYVRERGRLRDWLFGIAWRIVRGSHRRSPRPRPVELSTSAVHDLQSMDPAPDEQLFKAWQEEADRELFNRAVARVRCEVDAKAWQAFEETALRGRPAEAVALELLTTRNAVYLAKRRVLKRIEQLVRDYEKLP